MDIEGKGYHHLSVNTVLMNIELERLFNIDDVLSLKHWQACRFTLSFT
jgi:hypothetical protein